jgi:hypothetical protein
MGESIAPIMIGVLIALAGAVIYLTVSFMKLRKKLHTFMEGKDGASLEGALSALTQRSANLEDTLHAHKEALEFIDARLARSIRGYSLVRYNAYADTGGEQSFASGLLDEHGDGYILSVITNRNHVGVYAKKVLEGTSDVTLTEEESRALDEAKEALKK